MIKGFPKSLEWLIKSEENGLLLISHKFGKFFIFVFVWKKKIVSCYISVVIPTL